MSNETEVVDSAPSRIQFYTSESREVLRLCPSGQIIWWPPSGEVVEISDAPLLTIALMDVVQRLAGLPRNLSDTVPPELWERYQAFSKEE